MSENPLSAKQRALLSLPWKEEAENTEEDGHLEINTENTAPGQLLWASHYYEHSHLQAKGQLPGVTWLMERKDSGGFDPQLATLDKMVPI